jgi:hypothetical protein
MPRMERRKERRFSDSEPVVVTELGQRRLRPKGGLIVEVSEGSLTLKLPTAIACGVAVKVETKNMLMLGEVLRCDPAGDEFRIALKLRHSLQDLPALDKLDRALAADGRKDHPAGREKRAGREKSSAIHIIKE